ncbi:MAG: Re/Si-specific NAD(P)(+) transhydrogenase subunit alpha [Planctomycetia bacterium]|nr:MAG: Re/Si-specific NAD(P)(+) transhydrogenase subunit alpha [Planctomycetia bacterium]
MILAAVKEVRADERRVALVPESCKRLVKAGIDVVVQAGAGVAAGYPDEQYAQAGATVEADARLILGNADMVFHVQPPLESPAAGGHEADALKKGGVLVCTLKPSVNPDAVKRLAARGVTAIAMDCVPRTTRAQAMDVLSSQANIAGYKAVLLGANELPRYLPMFMTAAGTILAAKVFVIGAGVAGLQAIATARRLGAIVTATDVRPEVKEQIESVGAKYVGIELSQSAAAGGGYARELSTEDKARQAQLLAEQCAQVDMVVTTALIGGVRAPRLISEDIVRTMKPGSVIVDLAAEGGGNCALTEPGRTIVKHGVTILGPPNLPALVPLHASLVYSRNLEKLLLEFWKDGRFNLNLDDDILKASVITHAGEVVHPPTRQALESARPA